MNFSCLSYIEYMARDGSTTRTPGGASHGGDPGAVGPVKDDGPQTQRYLNVTDEELRKGLEVSWTRNRALRLVANGEKSLTKCHSSVTRDVKKWRARQDSNLWPSAPEADALSS
jgi:hypothetical protein